MITLHHLDNSRSQRILWMLEELGLKYEVEQHKRDPKTMLAPPSLKAVHPLGKAPVLVDDQLVLAESAAILEYLVDKYGQGKFKPAHGTRDYLQYNFWMHFAEGSAMTPLLLRLVFDKVANPPIPPVAKAMISPVTSAISAQINRMVIEPNLKRHNDFMESHLEKSTWFAGDNFTAADVQMSFVVEASAKRGGLDPQKHHKVFDYLKRIHARAAYAKALEVGGPFTVPT